MDLLGLKVQKVQNAVKNNGSDVTQQTVDIENVRKAELIIFSVNDPKQEPMKTIMDVDAIKN